MRNAAHTMSSIKVPIPPATHRTIFFHFTRSSRPAVDSEGLTQGQEKLERTNAGDRIQQMANIKSNWADRRVISKPNAHAVRVFLPQQRQIDLRIHVSSVVENRRAHVLAQNRKTYGNMEAQLRIQDQQHVASDGYANGRASRWIALIPARDNRPLRAGAVDGKAAQRIAAAGKKFFAQGHAARRNLLSQAETQIAGPGQIVCDWPVVRRLA